MDLPSPDDVLGTIDAFLQRHNNMAPTRFGAEATGDSNLIAAMRAGASPSLKRLHRIRDYMVSKDREAGFVGHGEPDTAAAVPPSPGKSDDFTARVPA